MTDILATKLKRFRTQPARGGEPQVEPDGGDAKAGIIRGASLVTRGEARSHYMWLDEEFLDEVAAAGKSAKQGVKARFTHPSLSGDGLGTFLGRWKNFRREDDRVIADLHFSRASHNTPDGDLAEYVMRLAAEDPQAFGTSIVFMPDYGAEHRFEAEQEDEDGNFQSPDEDNTSNYRHARLATLEASDVVDEPAANPGGMFHRGQELAQEADALCAFALGLADERPQLVHLSIDADRVAGFAARFLEHHQLEVRKKNMAENKPTEESTPAAGVTIEALNAFGDKLLGQVDERVTKAIAAAKPAEVKPSDVELERKRCSELFATAKNAGLTDWEKVAQEAIDKGHTLDAFKAGITDRLIQQNGLTKDAGETPSDPEAKYKKEYAAQRAAFASMGLSEKEYITSRRIDDGSELLAPAMSAAV